MWILFAIISSFGYSFNHIINKFILEKIDTWKSVFFTSFFVSLILFFFTFFGSDFDFSLNLDDWIVLVLGSIVWFVALWSLFKSFEFISIWESISIANIFPFVIVLFLFVSYQELIGLYELFWMIVVFLGIFLLVKQNWSFKFSLDTKFAFITAIGWGFYNFAIDYFVRGGFDFLQIAFMLELWVFLSSAFYLIFRNMLQKSDFESFLMDKKLVFFCFLSGLSTAWWTYFTVLAMSYLNAAVVGSIVSTQVVFAAILAYFILKERISYLKILWIFLVFVGIFIYNLI